MHTTSVDDMGTTYNRKLQKGKRRYLPTHMTFAEKTLWFRAILHHTQIISPSSQGEKKRGVLKRRVVVDEPGIVPPPLDESSRRPAPSSGPARRRRLSVEVGRRRSVILGRPRTGAIHHHTQFMRLSKKKMPRHCEERSDEAISLYSLK